MSKLLTLLIICLLPQFALAKLKCPPPKEQQQYDRIILAAAKKHKVDAALIHAVIKQESCYYNLAVSHAGAEGLMQLIPATARRFNVSNSFIPSQNINAGTKYLAWLLKRFKGNIRFALAGYNAGEGKVDRYKGIPPYKETRNYVKKVIKNYRQFKGLSPTPKPRKRIFLTKTKKKPYSGLEGRLRGPNDRTPTGLHFNQSQNKKNRAVAQHKNARLKTTLIIAAASPTIQGKRVRIHSVSITKQKQLRKGYTRVYAKQKARVRDPHAS